MGKTFRYGYKEDPSLSYPFVFQCIEVDLNKSKKLRLERDVHVRFAADRIFTQGPLFDSARLFSVDANLEAVYIERSGRDD